MTSITRRALMGAAFAPIVVSDARADLPEVDVALILATDVSGSVTQERFDIQVRGLAAAFEDPEIIASIMRGESGKVAVVYLQWSAMDGQWHTQWTLIDGPDSASAFAKVIRDTPRMIPAAATHMTGMLERCATLYQFLPYRAGRKLIDVSGDGVDSTYPGHFFDDYKKARDRVRRMGITINGLSIMPPPEDRNREEHLHDFYRSWVKTGPGSFHIECEGFEAFPRAIRMKILTELG